MMEPPQTTEPTRAAKSGRASGPSSARYRARYRRILFFFARILLSLVWWELLLPHLGFKQWSRNTRAQRLRAAASRFRSLAVQMGGVMIKVGQFFSSRVDVLPREITQELAGLQDEVPEERFEAIRQVAEAEFGMPLEHKFLRFEAEPVAAASLGQVHRAWIATPEGESSVVVKVLRPDIENIIATDLAALKIVGGWLQRYPPVSRRADVPALLNEFDRILHEEVDYIAEAHNAETFAANFAGEKGVYVPQVIWTHTLQRVLTLEDVQNIKITDYAAIEAVGIDRGEVARRLFAAYLKQIFEDGFFHADPHPGNLFVSPQPPAEPESDGAAPGTWTLTFIDFGMVGRVQPKMRAGMREIIIGLGTRDASRLVKAYQLLGVLLPGANLDRLQKAETEVFDRFWGKKMNELKEVSLDEVRALAREFADLIYDLPFQIPEDLILLGRTVGILSGMCTGLDPEFNVWDAIAPYAHKLIAEEAAAAREDWVGTLGSLARRLIGLPGRTEELLDKMQRGDLAVRDPDLTHQARRMERALKQVAWSVIFAALLLAGVQVLLAGYPAWGRILVGLAVFSLAWGLLPGKE